jgi:hypothetical protein
VQEICDTHRLLIENVDSIAPDKKDKLRELLADLVGHLLPVFCATSFSNCNIENIMGVIL